MQRPNEFSKDTSQEELARAYQKEGYLVLKDFYHPDECQALRQRMHELASGCYMAELGAVFCAEKSGHLNTGKDQYFRESGDKIHFFLEKNARRERYHYKNDDLVMDTLDLTPLEEASVPLEVSRGTLVVFHGRLSHRSCANVSDKSRHAYTLHIIDGNSEYPADNWLRRGPDMPLRGFYTNQTY